MRNLRKLNAYRWMMMEIKMYGEKGGKEDGVFVFISPVDGKRLRVIAAAGDGWDHVSVSREDRCPYWDEMTFIKQKFFKPEECVIQYHPPETEYVNVHPHCLHLWRPHWQEIPMPPIGMV